MVFNPCAVVDMSQIEQVRNGVRYRYCWKRDVLAYCAAKKRFYFRHDWIAYRVGHRPSGCSTHV